MSITDRRSSHASTMNVPSRVAALVPLVILSVVWTVHVANPYAFAGREDQGAAPSGGVSVPTVAPQDPASYSRPAVLGADVMQRRAAHVAAVASPQGIPSAALAAYQRAETVINAADPTCRADWQLLAALGRVESDHGRYGGSALGANGVSRPGIYGIALDGRNKTQTIKDTDAGQYDRDPVWDRAVGPMQFIPTTWSAVGVDADGDGRRDPQNINDAALAAAAYLCSGTHDLGNEAGRRAAVFRYNHSQSYVDLVLRAREAYLKDGYTAVPSNTLPAVSTMPAAYWGDDATRGGKKMPKRTGSPRGESGTASDPSSPPRGNDSDQTGSEGKPKPGPSAPDESPEEAPDMPPRPDQEEADKALKKVTEPLPTPVREPVDQVLTLTQAVSRCTAKGVSRLDLLAWNQCIDGLLR